MARPVGSEARYSEYLELDLSTVVPSIAGPKRPQDRIALSDAKEAFRKVLPTYVGATTRATAGEASSFPASDPSAAGTATTSTAATRPAVEATGPAGRPRRSR